MLLLTVIKHEYVDRDDGSIVIEEEILNSDDEIKDYMIDKLIVNIKDGTITSLDEIVDSYEIEFFDQLDEQHNLLIGDYLDEDDLDRIRELYSKEFVVNNFEIGDV